MPLHHDAEEITLNEIPQPRRIKARKLTRGIHKHKYATPSISLIRRNN